MRRIVPVEIVLSVLLVPLLVAAPARAQSPYVSGAVALDVSRLDRVEARGAESFTADGETVAFSLRLGTGIGERWGVEVGITRPSEVEREVPQGPIVPLAVGRAGTGIPVPLSESVVLPIVQTSVRLTRRNTTLETLAWAAQPIGRRASLVYLGGVSFNRITEGFDYTFGQRAGAIGLFVPSTTVTTYGVGPVVGLDGRIGLTDHVMLVPGFRLHGVRGSAAGGWLLRSSVGLGWRF